MNILLIGDFHIPSKAGEIPEKFLEEMRNSNLVLCTGDFTNDETFEKVKNNSPKLRVVRGDYDFLELPSQDIVNIGKLKIGLTHGDQIGKENLKDLAELGKKIGVKILISGHTHQPFKIEKNGILLLNPGTATGAKSEEKTCMRLKIEKNNLEKIEVLKA